MNSLKSSITVNQLTIHNRLVMPPMAMSKCDKEGVVSSALCDYYNDKSQGGHIGLIITEHCFVSQEGKASAGQLSIADDGKIEGLRQLVDTVHRNGTTVFAQISHAGTAASPAVTGLEAIGPSVILPANRPAPAVLPREMTADDMETIKDAFVKAALRAKAAGYDGIEIHSAHGYLLNQFYSPLTNHRSDAYGGDLSSRIRLHLEIIRAVRSAVGADYPIAIRLGACDYMNGGSTVEDAVTACRAFEQAGIDLLDISGGLCGTRNPQNSEPGYFKDASAAIREHVKIPVLLTGGITTAEAAQALLDEGSADMTGVGRAILKDSLWAKKAMSA